MYGANADVMLTLMLVALYSTRGTRAMHAPGGVVENAMQKLSLGNAKEC